MLVYWAARTTIVLGLQSNTLEEKEACFLREMGCQSERALNNSKPASCIMTFLCKKQALTFEKQGCIFTEHGFLFIMCRWNKMCVVSVERDVLN